MTDRDHSGLQPRLRTNVTTASPTIPTALVDSTTGTASDTLDDATSSVKDDLASLAAKVNALRTFCLNLQNQLRERGIL